MALRCSSLESDAFSKKRRPPLGKRRAPGGEGSFPRLDIWTWTTLFRGIRTLSDAHNCGGCISINSCNMPSDSARVPSTLVFFVYKDRKIALLRPLTRFGWS